MLSEVSIHIARILGPVLMIIASSEFIHFKIWRNADPTLVTLNGMVLLICGMTIIAFHNIWAANWVVVITILGWLIGLGGVYRVYFPHGKQAERGVITNVFLLIIFLLGLFLTFKGYIN
jgi:hypothetical protein